MNKLELESILLEACKTGADYAELYFEDKTTSSVRVILDKVDEATTKSEYGCALRLLNGLEETYGYTNDVSFEGVMALAKSLRANINKRPIINEVKLLDNTDSYHTNIKDTDIDYDRLIKTLKGLTKDLKEYDERIVQAISSYTGVLQKVLICSTKGIYKNDVRFNQRIAAQAISQNEEGRQMGFDSHGGNFGFDMLMDFDYKAFARSIGEVAITMLSAKDIKGGVYDVVIHNGFGGVIFHEACGHSLEATAVAKNTSVFSNRLGERIASDVVTAVDDGTIAYEWGSENIDDEGNPQQKRVLIENGILKSYMIDYLNSRRMNSEITGSSRRQGYRFAPTSRMSNTYIANGKSKFEDIIKNTKYGLFAKKMGGGSVNPATGEFNFSVSEGYMIEDGKITTPVKGATLIGNGKDTLLNIDMVADNLSFGYGMCGSVSGSIPTCVGQPTIRVRQMTVGGKGGN